MMENACEKLTSTAENTNTNAESVSNEDQKKQPNTLDNRSTTKDRSSAKKRWQILKQALLQQRAANTGDSASVRRFSTFELLSTEPISTGTNETEHTWLQYYCSVFPEFSADIRHLTQQVKVDDLIGFNNTGNVCVWPSEEVLSYYCLKNNHLFRNQNVCELGGGMTCLAGVVVAVCSEASRVVLTDGNENSVNNVHVIIEKNKHVFGNTTVTGREMEWNERQKFADLNGTFDHIICADCLFFDQYRQDLVDTIDSLLKPGGIASIFAPNRGTTLQSFCDLAKVKFRVDIQDNYDATLWQKHQQKHPANLAVNVLPEATECPKGPSYRKNKLVNMMLTKGKDIYDENIHYPLFITLRKRDKQLSNEQGH